jgi:hypothetical protein
MQPLILMIGSDTSLNYLIGRYAEQNHFRILTQSPVPEINEVRKLSPKIILFGLVETLWSAQNLMADLIGEDIFILACTSVADEARARELGVDFCLTHPVTFEQFNLALETMDSIKRKKATRTKLQDKNSNQD